MRKNNQLPKSDSCAPRVAVLVETSTSWGRRLIRGVGNYVQAHEPWRLALEPLGINQRVQFPQDWQGDGIIARIHTASLAKQLSEFNVPVINVSGVELSDAAFAQVTTDERKIVRLAVEHFNDCGLRHFAFYSGLGRRYTKRRASLFARQVSSLNLDCHLFQSASRSDHRVWDTQDSALNQWLIALPKPVGILTWNAVAARRVAQVCQAAGLNIPDEVAILSVDTDELMGEVIQPSISGVRLAMERIGYEAAALLATAMRKTGPFKPPKKPVLIDPQDVVVRTSSDILAIDDMFLREAIRFIRNRADKPTKVCDVLKAVPVSRRTLEQGIKTILGRTPAQEIRRTHIERAQKLLIDTHMSIPQIALASGFRHVEHMIPVFRKAAGCTPLAYRKKMQGRSSV